MFFWNSLAFLMIQQMLAISSLVPLPFLNLAWTPGSSRFTCCWRQCWGGSLDRISHALCSLDLFTFFKNYWGSWSTYLCRFYLLALTLLEWKFTYFSYTYLFIPSGSMTSAYNVGDAGDMGSISGSIRSLEGGIGNPPQYPCLENPTDRGALGVPKSWTWLGNWAHLFIHQ